MKWSELVPDHPRWSQIRIKLVGTLLDQFGLVYDDVVDVDDEVVDVNDEVVDVGGQ